ncbi:YqhA family protein [Slackia piriformis]|uniref:YqhA family protein n=1 Tax=Slackia piriformis TaxID=626934 RepID=UPI002F94126C
MTENAPLRAADEERNAVPKDASALSDGNDASLEEGDNCQQESRGRRRERKLVGYSRFMAVVPSIGLFVSSIALTIATLISTVVVTFEAATGHLSMQDMLVEYIEYADFYLLAVVLYIMSVGLYSLFIDDGIDMPSWLQIHNLDDLKEKLVGVIVVVMGVYFLGLLIHGAQPVDLLLKGLGICAVIFALAYFVRHVMFAHKK